MDPVAFASRLRQHVSRLAARPRPPEAREHREARAYITEHFQRTGFRVHSEPQEEAGAICFNIVTDPEPQDPSLPLLVVGAHYDSVPDSPGADDNASAVAALLELAGWIRSRLADSLSTRLQLAAYDLEEYGLVGSALHAQELQESGATLRGMIALEMIGFIDPRPGNQLLPLGLQGLYPNVGTFIAVVGNEASGELVRLVTAGLKSVPGLPVEYMAVPDDGRLLSETRLSDHSSFWDRGFAALMITDTSFFRNPHYHKASDTPETLDYDFLARVTAGLCQAVWSVLQ